MPNENANPQPRPAMPSEGRLAGIDYGTVRVGISICDPGRRIASPLESYTRRNRELDAKFFRQVVVDYDIQGFVVGLPVHVSGNESQKSVEARRFGEWLGETTGKPFCFFDERYSTSQATALMAGAEFTSRKRKARVDKVAAQVILASYLESLVRGHDARRNESDAYRAIDD